MPIPPAGHCRVAAPSSFATFEDTMKTICTIAAAILWATASRAASRVICVVVTNSPNGGVTVTLKSDVQEESKSGLTVEQAAALLRQLSVHRECRRQAHGRCEENERMWVKLISPRVTTRPMDSAFKRQMAPPLSLLVLGALTPEQHRVTVSDENVERLDLSDCPDICPVEGEGTPLIASSSVRVRETEGNLRIEDLRELMGID